MQSKSDPVSRSLGRYIVVDPRICHGKPAFRGTRVLVSDVLEQVATGMSWDAIVAEWNGNVTKEAIAEAVGDSSVPSWYSKLEIERPEKEKHSGWQD